MRFGGLEDALRVVVVVVLVLVAAAVEEEEDDAVAVGCGARSLMVMRFSRPVFPVGAAADASAVVAGIVCASGVGALQCDGRSALLVHESP